jgi:hypothetical protein
MRNSLKKEVICTLAQSFHALLRWYKKNPTFCFLLFLRVIFVNFARKVSLEIFDKSRPK